MFGLFSRKQNNECPIDMETRLWMEQAFLWLAGQFGQGNIETKPILLPTPEHFPIHYDGSMESLIKTAEIVALQMDIDIKEVNLDIYQQSIQEFSGDLGYRIWTEVDKTSDQTMSSGLYFGKNEEDKYDVFIEKDNLADPASLVATLAHEFAHIKLLGEKRIEVNDESLTDLTPVLFGLGIFNANASFKEHRSYDSYGHNSIGYLKQREWGYALALSSFYRKEDNPEWINYLTPNIKSDFKISLNYILANVDKIFMEDNTGSS